jgi:hypothetical protein
LHGAVKPLSKRQPSDQLFCNPVMAPRRVIKQDPSVPRYSRRIPSSEWHEQKAFLAQLHLDGLTRTEMVGLLSSQRNFVASKHQLDNKMIEWGFLRYNKQRSQQPVVAPATVAESNPGKGVSVYATTAVDKTAYSPAQAPEVGAESSTTPQVCLFVLSCPCPGFILGSCKTP